jgi:hypothetical protein
MKARKISLEYNKREEVLFAGTMIVIEGVPIAILEQIAKQYSKEIVHEGIAHFIELDFGDVSLKFRLEGHVRRENNHATS